MKKLIIVFLLSTILLIHIAISVDPNAQEQQFFNVLMYRLQLHKDLWPLDVSEAIGTFDKELVIKFKCPNPPPKEGKIKIKSKLVHWEGTAAEKDAFYEWKGAIGVDGNEKVAEFENELSLDLNSLLPEPGLDKQASNTALLYHELLHAQLLIDAMQTTAWQADFCKCNFDWTPADLDDPHQVIPDLENSFKDNLTNRVVSSENPWNNTGNESDRDGDGIPNDKDKCPDSFDIAQVDSDNDGLGNSCDEDDDNDGLVDFEDNCPLVFNPIEDHGGGIEDVVLDGNGFFGEIGDSDIIVGLQPDQDLDGVGDACDNCINLPNNDQSDFDHDGVGDVCDQDDDNDGLADLDDNCDLDRDNDIDNDNVCGNEDNCVAMANTDQADDDNDGIGNVCDTDADNDGVLDQDDKCDNTILTPVAKGCSCFQILQIKPGPNHKEHLFGCSEKTIATFNQGKGWAKLKIGKIG